MRRANMIAQAVLKSSLRRYDEALLFVKKIIKRFGWFWIDTIYGMEL